MGNERAIDSGMTAALTPAADRVLSSAAAALAGVTLVLIIMGTLVTGHEAGDSVPDWPLAFGSVLPVARLSGAAVYEYAHRAAASLCALLAAALVFLAWARKADRGAKGAAVLALAMVLAQAALGGVRVIVGHAHAPPEGIISTAHASLAQLAFGSTVILWLLTRQTGAAAGARTAASPPAGLVSLALLAAAVTFAQLVLGAAYRHGVLRVDLHAAGAAVTALVLGAASGLSLAWLRARKAGDPWLAVPARAAGVLLLLQVPLGVAALVRWRAAIASHTPGTGLDIAIAASHTAVGSLLLAASLALALRHLRLRARRGAVSTAA